MSRRARRAVKARRRVRRSVSALDTAIIQRSDAAVPKSEPATTDRLWRALIIGGAAIAFGLFGREVADLVADRNRPRLIRNDIYSALESLAMLVMIGIFAWSRSRSSARGKRRKVRS